VHVVLACHRYAPVPGGSERIAQLVAEGAAKRGHTVTLVTQREAGVPDEEELNGVRVVRLSMRHVGGIRVPKHYLSTLRATEGDLFHLHGNRIWCADFYLPFAGRFDWPQLGTGHGFYQYAMHPRWRDRVYFERYFPRVLRKLDLYCCDTELERRQLVGWGFPEGKLARVPLGARLEEFTGPTAEVDRLRASWGIRAPLVAVYVGGFFENKRVDRMVDAVAATGGTWGLVAVGRDVPESPYNAAACLERARARSAEVRVAGVLSRTDTVAAIRAADVVLSASDYEGFGVTLAEALAAGRPFVSFRSGAAPEMAEGGGGRIVRGVEEMTQALRDLEDPATRAAMGRRALDSAPMFSESAMVDRYVELYERLADRGRGP
jgi:glycosyltransferase involved in cell wall biosynthesis